MTARQLERALAIKPDFAEALNNRGSALHELGGMRKRLRITKKFWRWHLPTNMQKGRYCTPRCTAATGVDTAGTLRIS